MHKPYANAIIKTQNTQKCCNTIILKPVLWYTVCTQCLTLILMLACVRYFNNRSHLGVHGAVA